MRSLDEFYKYVEKQEHALREQGERSAPAIAPEQADGRPEAGACSPADLHADEPPAVTGAAPERPQEADGDVPQTPPPEKPSPEEFVPPPRPPKAARPSRYESIVPAEALRPRAATRAEGAPEQNGHVPPSPGPAQPSPAEVRYVMRGGVTIPVKAEAGQAMPDIEAYIPVLRDPSPITPEQEPAADAPMRPRRVRRRHPSQTDLSEGEAAALWGRLPRHIQLLVGMPEPQEEVAQKYYTRGFKESRHQLIERLLDPTLTLEDTARVLGVCPTTVRRYTNRGLLPHHRTVGQQRRFRLSDVLAFLEQQSARGAAALRDAGARGTGEAVDV